MDQLSVKAHCLMKQWQLYLSSNSPIQCTDKIDLILQARP